ncbi:MAG: cation:proton antiporter [Candidatus Methanoplasma sp.]|nr:cation:proton antiporter [Candidatus Methanoplasma sp.]
MEIGSILIVLVVILALARLGSWLFQRFGLTGLIGEIVVGIVIANLSIGDWSVLGMLDIGMDAGQTSENYEVIELFSELGAIFLLFGVGLETRVKNLMSVGKAAMLVAVLGVIVPFILGFALILIYDGNMNHAMFLGAAMVATSVGITARVIKEMRVLHTIESRIIIAAAVIDDILGMVVLAIVVGSTASSEISISNIAVITTEAAVFVLAMIAMAMWVVPWLYDFFLQRRLNKDVSGKEVADEKEGEDHLGKLILAIVVCLGISWFADNIGLAAIIGAFLGGMLFADYASEWKLEERIEPITVLFLSFFFVHVGMQVRIEDCMNPSVLVLSAIVVILAVISKYVGCNFGARIGDKKLDKRSRNIIGVGMIPRGEVGIIVAAIGLSSGAMSSELYAVVVIMAVATTIIAPPLLQRAFIGKYPCGCPESPECEN